MCFLAVVEEGSRARKKSNLKPLDDIIDVGLESGVQSRIGTLTVGLRGERKSSVFHDWEEAVGFRYCRSSTGERNLSFVNVRLQKV